MIARLDAHAAGADAAARTTAEDDDAEAAGPIAIAVDVSGSAAGMEADPIATSPA